MTHEQATAHAATRAFLNEALDEINFRTQDHKLKQEVVTRYTPGEFINHLADHVPDHYKHVIRHFEPLSPGSKGPRSERSPLS